MMMEMQAPEPEVVVEAPQAVEIPQQTWFSFFTEMLYSAPQVQVQQQALVYRRQPLVGVQGVETFRVNGVTLSTGNLLQAILLRAIFPHLGINTSFSDSDLSVLDSQYEQVQTLVSQLRDTNAGARTPDDRPEPSERDEFLSYMRALYRDVAPGGNGGSDSDDNNDLPTKIAEAIARIYYETLELTVADIKGVITTHYGEPWNGSVLSLNDVDDDFVSRITHASIDNGRMQLRTILPHDDIVKIAVEELKHPPLTLKSILEWMTAVWDKFVELLTDGWEYVFSPSNP